MLQRFYYLHILVLSLTPNQHFFSAKCKSKLTYPLFYNPFRNQC